MEMKFLKCEVCGNVAMKFVDSGVKMVCCGQNMIELVPNTTDAAGEKHVPVVERVSDDVIRVKVGSVEHPMIEKHHIAFIFVETERGGIRVDLDVDGKPEAEVFVGGEKVKAVYEYCNLHGLWKLDM